MSIEQANVILKRALDEGLIGYDGEMLAPKFDISSVEVPIGFKPSQSVFELNDPVQSLIDHSGKIKRQAGDRDRCRDEPHEIQGF